MSHRISRRGFLASGAVVAASAVLAGCDSPRHYVNLEPFVRPPDVPSTGEATWYASTCLQCPSGCGIIVRTINGRAVKIEGNPEHPLNRGKLCARGQAGLQLLYHPDRFAGPMQSAQPGTQPHQLLGWDDALKQFGTQLAGAGSKLAIWGGTALPGHYYELLTRLASALGASAPVFYDLDGMVGGSAALSRTGQALFGQPGLLAADIGQSDVVFSFGADPLGAGPDAVRSGIEYGKFRSQRSGARGFWLQVEPRLSLTGAKADEWMGAPAGAEGLVAQALVRLIADGEAIPTDRQGRAKALAGNVDIPAIAASCGVSQAHLQALARYFATATHPVALAGPAVAGRSDGVAQMRAIHALNAVAGNFGAAGGVQLSPTVAGLPQRPTLSSYGDALRLLDAMRGGQVSLLLVVGSNPLYDLPASAGVGAALAKVPFIVSFAPLMDETAQVAHLILPERTYLEAWGYVVPPVNIGTPALGALQPVVTPVRDSRSAADVVISAAKAIPAAASALASADEVALLKGLVGALPAGAAGGSGVEQLWANFLQHGGWWPKQTPPVAALTMAAGATAAIAALQPMPVEYPYRLVVYSHHLLGGGRGASLPWLQGSPDTLTSMTWNSWLEVHPETAKTLGLQKGDLVRVASAAGEVEVAVYPYPGIRPDTVAIALGQGHTAGGRYARGRGVNALALISSTAEGGSELNWSATFVRISKTGRSVRMATAEWTEGVNMGFPNKPSPGD
jgi:anaerobic selenocysteine-containing dehydrogenase